MRTRYALLAALLAKALYAGSEDTASSGIQQDVRLAVCTKNNQSSFRVGEVITLELAYSLTTTAAKPYQITNASYDRSGRLGIESYQTEPATGWDDPLHSYFASLQAYLGGGLSSFSRLTTEPVVISRPLNEWVRFNQPGRYRLTVMSSRVSALGTAMGSPTPEIQSNEIWLTIVPATPEWQKIRLESATAVLAKHDAIRPRPTASFGDDSLKAAAAVLRYLGTPGAAREMARLLNDESVAFELMLGLATTPARPVALEEMEELLHDPTFPVSGTFLRTMSLVALPPETVSNGPEQITKLDEKFGQELLGALRQKRGEALAVSAYTVVDSTRMRSGQLPLEQRRQLTNDLVANFDRLPRAAQLGLLQYRWQVLDQDTMQPLLPKIAQRYQDFPELRESNAYEANALSAVALLHWWEVDPESARPAIIQEILRPKPRWGEAVLGILPDETLPEVEQQLADHLTRGNSNEEQIASLISRYASSAVEPQVAGYLDPHIGKEACAIQTPLLAYLLRVDPVAAGPRLEQAMAARGTDFSACNHSLLTDVAGLHDDPSLQDLAIQSLDDEDPQIIADAATYLRSYGTAAAEAPLWARFTAWSGRWKGHEAELRYIPEADTDGVYQASAGLNLMSALACGQGWLMDDLTLTRLLDLSVGESQRQQAEQFLATWRQQPRSIQYIAVNRGQFQIAQYHPLSTKSAIEKLEQFSTGASFVWAADPNQAGDEKAFEEVAQAVGAHGIKITRSPLQ